MTHENQFSVRRFRNRNGVFSFRVDGRLNSVRIRRNFKTLEEAALEKAALELKGLQWASSLPRKRPSIRLVSLQKPSRGLRISHAYRRRL